VSTGETEPDPTDTSTTIAGSTGSGDDPALPDELTTSFVSARSTSAPLFETGLLYAHLAEYDPEPFIKETETVGNCRITTTTDAGDDPTAPVFADFGPIALLGGSLPAEIEFVTGGGYAPFQVESALWTGGETLTFSAPGAAIPGFDVDVTAPSQVEITSPTLVIGADLTVDRANDLAITWTGASAGWLLVRFTDTSEGDGPWLDVSCTFDPSAASGVVPSSVLGRIITDSGFLSIDVVSATDIVVDEWDTVQMRAEVPAMFGARPYETIVGYR
jgi:hypothetical protein